MASNCTKSHPISRDGPGRGRRILLALSGLALTTALGGAGTEGVRYYSTAEAPRDYVGPQPTQIALLDPSPARAAAPDPDPDPVSDLAPAPAPVPLAPVPTRLARTSGGTSSVPKSATARRAPSAPTADESIARAKKAIADCQERFQEVHDYTCKFVKRERVDGRLTAQHVMQMKCRSNPHSVYFKFQAPNRGREAIYVEGRNNGKALAHDVGVGKFLAGTMRLDPRGAMAMEENRHPISEAGIGNLIETVNKHWAVELTPAESVITFHDNVQVGGRPCTMIESVHPRKLRGFMFHSVKLYIDRELGLPIRIENFDWPKHPGGPLELVEEYSYLNLRTNVGLTDADFDTANPQYSFGRF